MALRAPATGLEDVLAERATAAGGDGAAVREAIAGLATALAPAHDAAAQLELLADRIGAATRLGAQTRPDRVLATLTGDELVLAACVAAIGQRAGYDVDVVVGRSRALVAHADAPVPLALSLRHEGRLVDPHDLREDLHWAGAAEVGARLGRL